MKRYYPKQPTVYLTASQVVDFFLSIHAWWFDTAGNALHGKRLPAKNMLQHYVLSGQQSGFGLLDQTDVEYLCSRFDEAVRDLFDVRDGD